VVCLNLAIFIKMLCFLVQAETLCKDLEKSFEDVKKKFAGVLAYFGEDAAMTSTDFFTTLHKFIQVSIIFFRCCFLVYFLCLTLLPGWYYKLRSS
jgi:hypothetical protein